MLAQPDLELTIYQHLPDAEPAWRTIESGDRHYVFQTYDWLSLWHRTCAAAEHTEPLVVVARQPGGLPAMVLPLGVRRRFGCRMLTFLGGDVTDYNAPLLSAAIRPLLTPHVVTALWRDIGAAAQADVVWLSRMPETFADGEINPMAAAPHARQTDNAYAAMPLPSSFAAFARQRSKSYFGTTRRQCRKLEELGTVALEVAEAPPAVEAVVERALEQKRRRLAEQGARPMPPQREQFYRVLARSRIADGRPLVVALRLNDQHVATHVGALHHGRAYWLMPAYQSGPWDKLSVGRILVHKMVDWCIANGVEAFDLTVGDEEYKRFWADVRLRLFGARYPLNRRGAAFLAAWRLRQRWRQQAEAPSQPLPVPTRLPSAPAEPPAFAADRAQALAAEAGAGND